jgi:protoporphyrinogen oxidase
VSLVNDKTCECCILGAGPAGLGVAVELVDKGLSDILVIDRNNIVGGLSRTENIDGIRFDIGPHRFFTKNRDVNKLWYDTLHDDFKPVKRLTRIYYKKKYFHYPVKPINTLFNLGIVDATCVMLSYFNALIYKKSAPNNFEDWITQKFGSKLYDVFFRAYTEKIWGIPCNKIGIEFAEQRISNLDIIQVLKAALLGRNEIKTLIDQFHYPVLGAGQMYEVMAEKVVSKGGTVKLQSRVVAVNNNSNEIESVDVEQADGSKIRIKAKQYFSSIPITNLFKMINPSESNEVEEAVEALYFRDHITINLLVDGDDLFPDQWLYVHDPTVKMARIVNYNNFSKSMVGTKNKTAISVEYFTFQHEKLWKMREDELKNLAVEELNSLGLVNRHSVEQAWVIRETECYPTYYLGYREPYELLKGRLNQFQNLSSIGRGGMYKYNNQDHSIYSGILAARNYLKLEGSPYNLWDINNEAIYHESGD